MYDDMHMGDYVAVVLNFVNMQTEHTKGGVSSEIGLICDTAQ